MSYSITETVTDILEYMNGSNNADDFQSYLEENGLMIVPIEDPTNLRYGVDE